MFITNRILISWLVLPGFALANCPNEDDGLLKWSDATSWESGSVPAEEEDVVITKPILLDGETERLKSVTIKDGGKLVFDPSAKMAKISTDQILIDKDGEMHIGSTDCKFTGKAEVLLTGGMNDDEEEDPDFGSKFIGVKAGGTLEIHGEDKKSFVQLAKTVEPHPIIFENEDTRRVGIVIYEFNRNTGKLIGQAPKVTHTRHLNRALSGMSDSSVIVMASRGAGVGNKARPFQIYNEQEEFANIMSEFLGNGAELPEMDDGWTSVYDAFVIIIDRAPDGTISIDGDIDNLDEKDVAKTDEIAVNINGIRYITQNEVPSIRMRDSRFTVKVVEAENHDIYELELTDDVSSWKKGDKVVIASTDYDYEQAEEVEIVSVDGKKATVRGELEYTHFGEEFETMNMRAEVGLLTRNVLIHGEMGDECPDQGHKSCDEVDFDNYGGHTKAIEGFKSYNIEGAEFTKMGQMSVLGSYPIHFHMCKDTDKDGVNPLIQGNSIHHVFSRCVTIHGTHGVHVKNNVAHDTYGHCYFLEDGGEKRNVFDGNLGLTTRKGFLTTSDSRPTTFWLTSPLVTMTNNHAAGSDTRNGVGIWYLFPDKPVGLSAEEKFFQFRQAKHTPITLFRDNVAHSNGDLGLGFFRRLGKDHRIIGCSTYDPRVDPLNKKSEVTPVVLDGLIAFKNRNANIKMRATASQLENFKLADSQNGIIFNRLMLSGYQMVKNSLIIGESSNKGEPSLIKVKENGKWVKKLADRSIPDPRRPTKYVTGVYLDSEGPVHIHNVDFKGFRSNENRPGCGIQFKDDFRMGMGPSSSVKGLTFDFEEPEALKICHANQKEGVDEYAMILKDLDGSLTDKAGTTVMAQDDYLQDGMDCNRNDNWNMTLCNGDFARFYLFPKPPEAGATFITKAGDEARASKKKKVSYVVRSDVKVVMHWTKASLKNYRVRVVGVKKDNPVTVGFCLPKGAEEAELGMFLDFSSSDRWKDDSDIIPADSLNELDTDTTGKNVFLDKNTRILYVKFIETKERTENDLADCPGGNLISKHCPWVHLNFKRISDGIDLNKADCT